MAGCGSSTERGDTRPNRVRFLLNGRGRTLIPGLIDAHGHVMGLGMGALQLDLSDTGSLAEAQRRIAAYAAANPTPRWILGRGWNQERWRLGRFPTAADLDAAAGDRPVWLERVDGHAGWANSAAMREAHVDAATQAPAGGRIERDRPHPQRHLRRQCDEPDRACGAAAAADHPRRRARPRPGDPALLRPHHRRRHGDERRGLGGDAPRRRRRPAQPAHPFLRLGDRQSARRRRHRADALALRRPPADGRGQALSRRRAGLARRLAQGALSRRAGPARPAAC